MAFNVKERGRITYYYTGDHPTLSALVTEAMDNGDLKIYFAGLTGGHSATGVLGLDEVNTMSPTVEVELVFRCWEKWLQEAGICTAIKQIDFIEMHAFAAQPKTPNPLADSQGFADEQQRLYQEYGAAYSGFFRDHMPDCGVPARFTVHVVDFPDKSASYEFYSVGYYQKALHD